MQLADKLTQLRVGPAAEVYLPSPGSLFQILLVCGIFISAAAGGPGKMRLTLLESTGKARETDRAFNVAKVAAEPLAMAKG